MIIEYTSGLIGQYAICAIEYGDFSGVSDEDQENIEAWLADMPEGYKTFQYSDNTEFASDEISGLMADCVEYKIFMNQSDI